MTMYDDAVVELAEVEDVDDVLVADLDRRARLVEEARHDLRVRATARGRSTLIATLRPMRGCSAR